MGTLDSLIALSRRYGADPDWVLAGGGNTSWKDAETLYVKASGTSLATIGLEGFCAIDRARLAAIWDASYPEETQAREAAALADLMAARRSGEAKRPSVETLMHGLFPQAYVVHTHPAAVNGLTCGRGGEAAFARLFAEEGVWIPFVDPGYILAKLVRGALEAFRARKGRLPSLMLMQNHGLLVAGESPEEIAALSERVMDAVRGEIRRWPDLAAASVDADALREAAAILSRLAAGGQATAVGAAWPTSAASPGSASPGGAAALCMRFRADVETLARAASREAFAPLASAFTPDHIVYAGHEFLHVPGGPAGIEEAWAAYVARNHCPPRVALVRDLGAFAWAASAQAADSAIALYADACKVAAYAESFGGALHMTKEKIDFIRNWEVEKYRSKVSAGR